MENQPGTQAVKQSFWWAVAAICLLALVGLAGAGESLWVDELHTSWAVAHGFSEVAPRANLGNQPPLYFWGLWTLVQTLGQSELILRLPSIVAMATILWVATRFTFFSMQAQSALWISVVLLIALIIDRVQLFYTTEARVYAVLQLCHLLGWFQVHALLFRDRQQPVVRAPSAERSGRWLHWALWMMTTVVACYLHYVAVLIVGVQWCVLFVCLLAGGRYVALREMVVVTCVSGLLVLPLFPGLGEIWNRRSQWTAFAGDASINSLQRMFPWFAWLVPTGLSVLVCRLQIYFTQPGCNREATSDAADQKAEGEIGIARVLFWVSACFVPVLLIWLITFLDWAPIVHRRYAIGCAIPLVLCCVFALGQWCTPGYRWLAIAGTCTWLVVSQGTLNAWLQGQLIGWQRVEGWREASHWIEERYEVGDELWVASGLIEGNSDPESWTARQEEYLAFPLKGIYQVTDDRPPAEKQRTVRPLVGGAPGWYASLTHNRDAVTERAMHVVFRGAPDRFDERLEELSRIAEADQSKVSVLAEQSFGRVCVAKIVIAKTVGDR